MPNIYPVHQYNPVNPVLLRVGILPGAVGQAGRGELPGWYKLFK